jgi:PPM family protein phosphatase
VSDVWIIAMFAVAVLIGVGLLLSSRSTSRAAAERTSRRRPGAAGARSPAPWDTVRKRPAPAETAKRAEPARSAAKPSDHPSSPGSGVSSSRPPPVPEDEAKLPSITFQEDAELDLTHVTVRPAIEDESTDGEDTETHVHTATVVPIVYDEDAVVEEPTGQTAYILITAVGQTNPGKRRQRNEDSYLLIEEPPLFVVADGMGGYAGGEVASSMAVQAIEQTFRERDFNKKRYQGLPRRSSELMQAIQTANGRIFKEAKSNRDLQDMGTTLICARFSPNKQRLYIGHVGDSRCYVLRDGALHQITTDHTMAQLGVTGKVAAQLTRALGIAPRVTVDLVLGKPRPGDRYLLCSDGLSKMLKDEVIRDILAREPDPDDAVKCLVDAANDSGGKDNITVILIRVDPPVGTFIRRTGPPPTNGTGVDGERR